MTRTGAIMAKKAGLIRARAIAALAAGLGLAVPLTLAAPSSFGEARAAAGPGLEAEPSVELSESQLKAIRTEAAAERIFPQELNAAGTIDFNQELLTQVFTPYQGRILKAYPSVGDRVG